MSDKRQIKTILKEYFEEWERIRENGVYDFLCTDGEVLNTMRYSIINLKKEIENNFDSTDYPEIYYRDNPPVMSEEYMANSEDIVESAQYNLNLFKQSFSLIIDMAEMNIKDDSWTESDLRITNFVRKYQNAIENNDLVSMRWINRYFMDYYQSMGRIFGYSAMKMDEELLKDDIMEIKM